MSHHTDDDVAEFTFVETESGEVIVQTPDGERLLLEDDKTAEELISELRQDVAAYRSEMKQAINEFGEAMKRDLSDARQQLAEIRSTIQAATKKEAA